MAQVIKDVNWSLFKGNEEEEERFKELLTFIDPAAAYTKLYRRGHWDGKRKMFKRTTYGLIFRSGLISYLSPKFTEFNIQDVSQILPTQESDLVGLRDYQKSAVEAVKICGSGIISVPTGGGKTWIGAGVFKAFKAEKYLYLVHRVELLWQVYALFGDMFKDKVGRVGAGHNEWNKKYIIGMVQSLVAKMNKGDAKVLEGVELLIIDEAHHGSCSTYKKVVDGCKDLKVKVGLTGTVPPLDTVDGLMLRGVLGDVIYDIPISVLVDKKVIVGPSVVMYSGNWNEDLKGIWKQFNWHKYGAEKEYWDVVRDRAIIRNAKRNKVIADLVKDKSGVLVVVDLLEHGKELARLMGCPFAWSGVEGRYDLFERFRKGEIKKLVSSPILEEGVDVSGINVVVMASGGKSKRKMLQRIGRGMRVAKGKVLVEVIDFYDGGIPLLERHSKHREKVYREMGFPVEIKESLSQLTGVCDAPLPSS